MELLMTALTTVFELPVVAAVMNACDAAGHVSSVVQKIKTLLADDNIESRIIDALNRALENACIELGWEYDSMVVSEFAGEAFGREMNVDELSSLLKQYVGPAFNTDAVKVWVECFEKVVAKDQELTNYLLIKRSNGLIHKSNTVIVEKKQPHVLIDSFNNGDSVSCVLRIKRNDNKLCLDEESLGRLKRLGEDFPWQKRYPVNVYLELKDFDEIVPLIVCEDVLRERGKEAAFFVAEQTLHRNFGAQKEILEKAIEFMLQDELLDAWAHTASMATDEYEKRYGFHNCFYFDKNGIQRGYWTYFLWVDIIDELLKELLMSRANNYSDMRSMVPVDCWVENQNRKRIWEFMSFFSTELDDSKMREMWRHLSWCDCDCIDIHPIIRVKHLCPDLYYNMGQLKVKKTKHYDEIIKQFPEAFNLLHYRFGNH